jgi:6-phosphogluconolactonase
VLLGLGPDGHTASLFPGAPALGENRRFAAAARPPGGLPRVTLTLPVLNAAREAVFLVTGREKSAIARKVLNGGGGVPAALVRPRRGSLVFLLDASAAGGLRPG